MTTSDKNLLVITSAFPYGDSYRGVFIKDQIEILKDKFKSITVISPLAYFPAFFLKSKKFKEYSRHTVFPINYSFDNVTVFFPRYFPSFSASDKTGKKIGRIKKAVLKSIQRNNVKFDLIHAHFLFPGVPVGISVKQQYNKPLIITGHGGDVYKEPYKDPSLLKSIKRDIGHADAVITTSQANAEIITKSFRFLNDKLHVISNGFDPNLFYPIDMATARGVLGIPSDGIILISVGNLVPIKGHVYLIEAMRAVVDSVPNVKLFIVGAGSADTFRAKVETLGLEPHITIIEGVSHDVLPLWLNASDLFVLPSLNEGSPTIVAEALGCGKPVVATSVGSVPEIVKEYVGIIVPPKDVTALSEAILEALRKEWDPDLIRDYANASLSLQKIGERIASIYREVSNYRS